MVIHPHGSISAKPTWAKGAMLFERKWEEPSAVQIIVPPRKSVHIPPEFAWSHLWSPYDVPWWDHKAIWCKDCWDTGIMESMGGRKTPCYCPKARSAAKSSIVLPSTVTCTDDWRERRLNDVVMEVIFDVVYRIGMMF